MFSRANKFVFQRATELRERQTAAEEILWNYLKTKPLGFKFRRQHPFSCYILDFYCHALKLAIEVNGSFHEMAEVRENDKLRQVQLEKQGLTVLRFTNDLVDQKNEEIIKQLESYLRSKTKPK
jgi:imidazole glycerol-phosphate synthase subunit HisF